jgi:hypothetical protein
MDAGMNRAPIGSLRVGDVLVSDFGAVLRFERQSSLQFMMGVATVLLGLLFKAVSEWALLAALIPKTFLTWVAFVLMFCGGLLIAIGVARRIESPWELDAGMRCLKKGRRRISFADVRALQLVETQLGSTANVGLRLECTVGTIWLIQGQLASWRETIQGIKERVEDQLHVTPATSQTITGSPTRFWVAFGIGMGALWSGSMAWLAPGLVFTSRNSTFGFRAWPLGLWIVALALGELAGLSTFKTLLGPWNRHRVFFFIAWMGSYFLATFVRLPS